MGQQDKKMNFDIHRNKLLFSFSDSLYWIRSLDQPNILKEGQMFGCWHSELEKNQEVLNFVCLGSKSYALLLRDKNTGKISSAVKCKGLTLSNPENSNLIDYNLYATYLENNLNEVTKTTVLRQYRRKSLQSLADDLKKHYTKVVFSNAISLKGVVDRRNMNYTVKPFGHV